LVANKVDLCSEESGSKSKREVTTEEAEAWANEEGLLFLEASAKSGENVDVAFEKVSREILEKIKNGVFENGRSAGVKQSKTLDPQKALEIENDTSGAKSRCC